MKTHVQINEAKGKSAQRPYPKGSDADAEIPSVSSYTTNVFFAGQLCNSRICGCLNCENFKGRLALKDAIIKRQEDFKLKARRIEEKNAKKSNKLKSEIYG